MKNQLIDVDRWRRCESCFTTEITCTGMRRDSHVLCCTSCAHPSRDGED